MNRLNRTAIAGFTALAAAVTIAGAAQADTLYLTCNMGYAEKHTVDLAANTVDNVPARINASAIDWVQPIRGDNTGYILSGSVTYHIDRTAGTLTEFATYNLKTGRSQSSNPNTGSCQKDPNPPAAKF